MQLKTRIAPTPSGYLHLGNAVNFVIAAAVSQAAQGHLHLRIDDLDASRVRVEYLDDIFFVLDWLGIVPASGPGSVGEAHKYSQENKKDRYESLLQCLKDEQFLYACNCSRKEIRTLPNGNVYQGVCRHARLPFSENLAWRFKVPDENVTIPDIKGKTRIVTVATETGDFVVRRKDGLAAYHLASLADDLDQKINFIVRGEDLLVSTASQILLAGALGGQGKPFCEVRFLHHALIRDPQGQKLSKSQANGRGMSLIASGLSPTAVFQLAAKTLALPEAKTLAGLAEGIARWVS